MTIPVGYAQVTHTFSGTNCPTGAAVVYGVRLDDPVDTPLTVAQKAQLHFLANIVAALTNDVTLASTICKFGPDDTGPFTSIASGTAGGIVTTSLAPNTCWLFVKNTGLGGRRGRGRMFCPGVGETAVDDSGNLTGAWPTDWGVGLEAWRQDLITEDIPMVVLHSPSTEWVLVNGQPRRVPVAGPVPAPTQVTSIGIGLQVATQRRRLRR